MKSIIIFDILCIILEYKQKLPRKVALYLYQPSNLSNLNKAI